MIGQTALNGNAQLAFFADASLQIGPASRDAKKIAPYAPDEVPAGGVDHPRPAMHVTIAVPCSLTVPPRQTSAVAKMAMTALLAVALAGCAGSVPGEKTYWDANVREMCEKDGGVVIFEHVVIPATLIERRVLPTAADGRIGVAIRELAHPEAPVYAEESVVMLRETNPQVSRREMLVKRRIDHKVVAKQVTYRRSGGDVFHSPTPGSAFGCPDPKKLTDDLNKLFIVERGAK